MRDTRLPEELSRRSLLKGALLGTTIGVLGGQTSAPSALAAGKAVSVGNFHFDPTSHLTEKEFLTAATKAGFDVKAEEIEHFVSQSHIANYLQGSPAEIVDFGSGYRLQYAVNKGLLTDLTDIWIKTSRNFPRSYKVDSTAADGRQYLIPVARYPWAIMYRKSIFRAAGIDPAAIVTWADFINACKTFKSKGLTPIALGDASGWEALGTFEFVNLRTNGFKFHRDLVSGRASWNDARVQKTFRNWESMFPYQNSNVLELDWASAGRLVLQNKAAMQVMGSFHAQLYTEPSDLADLGLFAFPEISKPYHRNSLVAPVNGFAVTKSAQKNSANVKSFATWLASAEYANALVAESPTTLVANTSAVLADSAFVRQQAALVKSSKYFTQTLERDMRPDFVGPIVGPAMQAFLKNPGDKKKIAANLAAQWVGLPSV
jgi:multiple sugar transport system substrate-binding protein